MPAAVAADAPAPDQALEEIIVTGSRIPRADFESASPVVTIPQDRFEQAPAPTLEATLYYLPQFAGGTNGTSNNDLDNPQGQAQVALRGLGPQATLVLVDGRRLIPANGNGVPDVNVIPPSLVEHVELLTGGASAVYGSDALAGVMNIRLRHNYEGLEFAGDWGQTGRGDGQTYTATLTAGTDFGDGRGAIMGSVAYSDRSLVTQSERKYSRVGLLWVGPGGGQGPGGQFVGSGSNNILEGRYAAGSNRPSREAYSELFGTYGYTVCTEEQEGAPPSERNCLPYQRDLGFNSDGSLFAQGTGDPGTVANFRGVQDPLIYNDRRYQFNNAPYQALMMPLDRASAFVNGNFRFSDAAELYAQGIYAGYTVTEQLAPTPIPTALMPASNPYIPPDLKFLLDSRPNPAGLVALSKRTLETGLRDTDHNYSFYQVALGLRGTVFTGWDYNGYVQYGRSDQQMTVKGNVDLEKFEELLAAPDGGVATCGGADPFGINSISPGCASYMSVTTRDTGKTTQTTAEFSLSGSPVELPAGALNTVLGLFYRKDTYEQRPDPLEQEVVLPGNRPRIAGFGTSWLPMSADDHNIDAYTEVLVPLLEGRPGAKSLKTVLGYRWSDYASAGTANTYKAELLYEPVDALLVRGSFQHAVRAPSLFEVYEPQVNEIAGYNPPDPCSVGSPQRTGPNGAAVDALCVAQGIPADQLATFYDDSGEAPGFFGGNPDLRPEKGRTWTAGAVLNSPFALPALQHLQLSLDWWNIQIRDAITYYFAADFIPQCYDPKYNPDFSAGNKYCSWFARDAEAGGYIVDAYELERNIAVVETSGVDMQVDWRLPAGPGEIGTTWLLTWLASYDFQGDPEVKPQSWKGTGCCPTLPEWKWSLDTHYQVGGFGANVIWSYLGHIDGRWVDGQDHPSFQVPVRNYVDLTATYAWDSGPLDGLTLRIGCTNVFDEQPPIFPAHGNANSDLAAYDALGRSLWVGVNYAVRPGGN
ncbi:MAG TPA: TonB-dependent receptor [Steroidobacteraceae bacterium]|nr:TonB-dependent receptor [Steroidobacteraceae bacterium]